MLFSVHSFAALHCRGTAPVEGTEICNLMYQRALPMIAEALPRLRGLKLHSYAYWFRYGDDCRGTAWVEGTEMRLACLCEKCHGRIAEALPR